MSKHPTNRARFLVRPHLPTHHRMSHPTAPDAVFSFGFHSKITTPVRSSSPPYRGEANRKRTGEKKTSQTMTARPQKRCRRPYCPNPAQHPSPLCNTHRAELDATYTRHRAIYDTPQWQDLSRAVLSTRPVCQRCHHAPSAHAHHITALTHGGRAYDPNNVEALCLRCHGRETAREVGLGHPQPARVRPRPPTQRGRRRPNRP